MAGNLTYKPLDNIGVNGLNTQTNPTALDPSWLTKAENVILRESGRISARKGMNQLVANNAQSLKIGALGYYKDDSINRTFAAIGDSIYEVDFGTPTAAFTSVHQVTGADSNWQFVNFNRKLYAFQKGVTPIEYDGTNWSDVTTAPSAMTLFDPNCAMGYYGRIWAGGVNEESDVLFYTDILQGNEWLEAVDNTAGYIDLKTVWGDDEIVAVAPFYGQLVIFGKRNIAIYKGPTDPDDLTQFGLTEVIRGVGCVARDSVKAIGDDLVFLSPTGLRSLSRTTELDKVPLSDYSVNVKDTLIRHTEKSANVKACYVENEGIYLMTFVDLCVTYVFDFKHFTPNKAPRVTMFNWNDEREPTSMIYTPHRGFLVGQKQGGIAAYDGYKDRDYSTPGNSYNASFSSVWLDLGDSVAASLLKKMKMIIEGGAGTTMNIRWYKDYGLTSSTTPVLLNPVATGTPALWGASGSLYMTSKYTPIYSLKEYNVPLSGSAKHLKIEMNIESNGSAFSLQDLTLLHKQGKIR